MKRKFRAGDFGSQGKIFREFVLFLSPWMIAVLAPPLPGAVFNVIHLSLNKCAVGRQNVQIRTENLNLSIFIDWPRLSKDIYALFRAPRNY